MTTLLYLNPHHAKLVGFFTFSGKMLFTPNPKLGRITCGIATPPVEKIQTKKLCTPKKKML